MGSWSSTFFLFPVALLLLSSGLGSVFSQEVDDESEFSYIPGADNGPERWSLLHKNWSACNSGRMQSPIDLSDARVREVHSLQRLRRTYRPAQAKVVNRGHDISLKFEDDKAGALWLEGKEYGLKQLHWHSPSEHTVNGRKFALELHMVHQSSDNKIAVVAILYMFGHSDAFLSQIEKYIREVANDPHDEEVAGVIDPRQVQLGSRKYYRYIGSLTTPPCTEGVVWTIVDKVRTVSREQVRLLRDAVNDDMENNARPPQSPNHRMIDYYRPSKTQK